MGGNVSFDALTLEQKAGQLFFIGIEGPRLDDATKMLLDDVSPGGVCLFARNIREAAQTRELLDGLRSHLPVEPLLSVDQEGGLVDRLRRIMTPMPAASKLRDQADASRLGDIVGETLSILGFNMDFAPVVDVIDDERSHYQNGLLSRTFGKSKEDALAFAAAFTERLRAHGIKGCLKHFPGLGASQVDSHEELPSIDVPEDRLNAVDLFPYRQWELVNNSPIPAVMVAHAAFPGHSLQRAGQNGKLIPSSLSYNFVTKLLRRSIGFDGLVITDDLEMGAILKNFGIGKACKMAVNAGVDMLAICAHPERIREGHRAVISAVESGEISKERLDESLGRISRSKMKLSQPPILNTDRLAELSDAIAAFNAELGS